MNPQPNVPLAIGCFAAAFALISLSLSLFYNTHRCSVSTVQLVSETLWGNEVKVPMTHKLRVCGFIFPTIFILCGISLIMNGLKVYFPTYTPLLIAHPIALAVVTLGTMCGGLLQWRLFSGVIKTVEALGDDPDECMNQGGNRLNEVLEMVKESVIVLSDDLTVTHCNHASLALFSVPLLVGVPLMNFIHPEDVRKFNDVATCTLASCARETFTAEFRVRSNSIRSRNQQVHRTNYSNKCAPPRNKPVKEGAERSVSGPRTGGGGGGGGGSVGSGGTCNVNNRSDLHRVYCDDSHSVFSAHTQEETYNEEELAAHEHRRDTVGAVYVWIECTMCKGTSLNAYQEFDYSIKMVARDINERKRRELNQYQDILKETEEVGRVNAAKLQYISCITHDLKTPLQSFAYTLDLLSHTPLLVEQSEFIEQANVAVDLMKLTISQTMDISKALTGAKLQPRRTTVSLSAVLKRVKIIIDGYGKQVPLFFQVLPDICDEIITDEEWLWQMLLNLLTNACKYTDKGSICLQVSVLNHHPRQFSQSSNLDNSSKKSVHELGLAVPPRLDAMLLIEVHDTGVGVSSEKIDTLFDAFSQVQEGQVVGTGLGLYGVRTRVEGLNGTCGARHNTSSATGSGTVIWFSIPYTPDPSGRYGESNAVSPQVRRASQPACVPCQQLAERFTSEVPADKADFVPVVVSAGTLSAAAGLVVETAIVSSSSLEKEPAGIEVLSPKSVLQTPRRSLRNENAAHVISNLQLTAMVVEDTMSVRKLMEKLLYMMGFASVVCYENGAKGLDAMMAAPVDIVFSDVQMPIMTGPEMVKRFRAFETAALQSQQRLHRQLIVAVTANGSDLTVHTEEGFDEICAKPLSRRDITRIVLERFDAV